MSDITAIAVPKWGIEMVEGTVNIWNKAVGDTVAKGEEILEMESDKIVNVWESPADGVLRRILVEEGEARPVGALLGVIAADTVDDASIDSFIAGFGSEETKAEPAEKPTASSTAAPGGDAATRSAPAVRNLAAELGVDLNTVTGTGRRGRITEDDVRAAVSGSEPETDSGVEITPLSATRQTIAKRLTQAKQDIPHFYLSVDFELDTLLAYRETLNTNASTRVSVNDLLVKCVAQALQREPRVNVNFIDGAIHQFSDANVAVAIATEDGLYPATLRAVQNLSPQDIAVATAELAERARNGSLSREDLSGGSFTVSNLGMFGIDNFTAIVNPPMGAILALGKGTQKAVVKAGELAIATVVTATLSCDHRVIDGAVGANFLKVLGEEIAALG
ncbi:2-oxo acid dehydrogenase subunit E2 [Halioglobus maricola]|uniref:Dihydrolipoamide acetyltransferase component of pyruvate dehydrogenase complex n=1 Tax=Halioglobus maricola TaxID=2601894 RepID=A0A5P9NGW0_9GAMM|nr:dihydrolipoamide acetyltransferase family protein [Halioglobus maricola]QFU75053.1 2-oxo acid dehydrogenase subunit E2 [Halioglobus maricola]